MTWLRPWRWAGDRRPHTGLGNRHALVEELTRLQDSQREATVIFIDLDNFKTAVRMRRGWAVILDGRVHAAGDTLDLDARTAAHWCSRGWAEPVPDRTAPPQGGHRVNPTCNWCGGWIETSNRSHLGYCSPDCRDAEQQERRDARRRRHEGEGGSELHDRGRRVTLPVSLSRFFELTFGPSQIGPWGERASCARRPAVH